MIGMVLVFYMFLAIFAFAGATRGWAKEMLVIFSIVLALAVIAVLENLVPFVGPFLAASPVIQYWMRMGMILALTYFGYQSPKMSRLVKATEKRDRIQDILLGTFMGLLTGYFVIGTLWSFSAAAGYPMFSQYILPPNTPELTESTNNLLKIMPPIWLGKAPNIYIAVVLAFIFVIVVFV